MNNWKDAPHLFANGNFYVDAEPLTSIKGDIYEFDGFIGEIIGIKNDHNGEIIDHIQLNPDDCTLIARKIEDMTNEEYNEHQQLIYTVRNGTHGIALFRGESVESFLYLLSIGVYPFSQDHFGETVIDIKEFDNE